MGDMPELSSVINSPGMWIASSVMIIVIVFQSVLFMRSALKEADRISFPKATCVRSIRAAAISALGPSLAPIIILIALITLLGAPTAWMRLNDIGASRTELAVVTMTAKFAGAVPGGEGWDLRAFDFSLWGMALNNVMWMLVALLCTSRMSGLVLKMNEKYDPRLVKGVMAGAALGLFGILLARQVVTGNMGKIYAAAFASLAMLFIIKFLVKKLPWVREPALGLAMMVGMFTAAALIL